MELLLAIYSFLTRGQRQKRDADLQQFISILLENFSYFRELSATEKTTFLLRLYNFRRSKNFHLIEQEPNPAIEVLISAAAVQLTFGMRENTFPYFDDIFVTKNAYTYGFNPIPWAGHVNSKGIYISWYHFSFGYRNNNDRYNLGLHEMAHALEYEFEYGKLSEDGVAKKSFEKIMSVVNGIISSYQSADLFTSEGLQNKHERWAETVELFFENPTELNIYYPDLYIAVKALLGQDPLNNIKMVDISNLSSQ